MKFIKQNKAVGFSLALLGLGFAGQVNAEDCSGFKNSYQGLVFQSVDYTTCNSTLINQLKTAGNQNLNFCFNDANQQNGKSDCFIYDTTTQSS